LFRKMGAVKGVVCIWIYGLKKRSPQAY